MFPFTLHQLRILKAIAIKKNFTKAANELYLSQPSLTKQIKLLEKNLNTKLINRNQNKIFLTESGKILLEYSERILALCEESCRVVIDFKNGDRGNLIVGASQTTGTYLMPQILTLFMKKYPQMNLTLQVNSTRIITKKVINREIDIAIVGGKIYKDLKPKIKYQQFVLDELALIISKKHSFAKKKKINKEDLYLLDFITLNSTSTIKTFIDHTLLQNQIEIKQLKTILQLNSIEGIKTAVSLGLGVAFVSYSAIQKELKLKLLSVLTVRKLTINRKLSIISNPYNKKLRTFEFFVNKLISLKQRIENEKSFCKS